MGSLTVISRASFYVLKFLLARGTPKYKVLVHGFPVCMRPRTTVRFSSLPSSMDFICTSTLYIYSVCVCVCRADELPAVLRRCSHCHMRYQLGPRGVIGGIRCLGGRYQVLEGE